MAGVVVPSLLVSWLLLLVVHVTSAQLPRFYREPKDGDACYTFQYELRYTAQRSLQPQALRIFSFTVPCREGQVVNSSGQCVHPAVSDRCQPTAFFTPQYLQQRCRVNPTLRFADPFSCANYYDCTLGSSSVGCPANQLYDDLAKMCRPALDVHCGERKVAYTYDLIPAVCAKYPHRIMPNADNCNGYYNCSMLSDPEGQFQPFEAECPYFQLFDVESGSCRPFDQVVCNNRREIKAPCDLRQFACGRSSHCRPCYVDLADCTQLPDGDNAFPGQEYSPKYAQCQQGRTLGTKTCRPESATLPRLFDPRVGSCVSARTIPRSLGGIGPEDGV